MGFEVIAIAGLVLFVIIFNNKNQLQKFIISSDSSVNFFREKDYDFYVVAKYGNDVDPNILYSKRIRMSLYAGLFILLLFITDLTIMNFLKIIGAVIIVYKLPYVSLKKSYKKYMSNVDSMLPYYLKGLEILCQNYTVPVALSKSIEDAPDIFKPGLKDMISRIDAGDSSIDPYMDFAKRYPVKDSMRMMRLLYRLSLGAQENKHEQLTLFSKSVSTLQNKARETRYKARLDWMERQTMVMLVVTGGGMLLVLMFSMLFML
ncbi:MAG: hypothetical protein PUD59_00100 [bacterium]|nr:hypothetical protein [bacterium]